MLKIDLSENSCLFFQSHDHFRYHLIWIDRENNKKDAMHLCLSNKRHYPVSYFYLCMNYAKKNALDASIANE